jgi:hypothetical protein
VHFAENKSVFNPVFTSSQIIVYLHKKCFVFKNSRLTSTSESEISANFDFKMAAAVFSSGSSNYSSDEELAL